MLYHGTCTAFEPSIKRYGLKPMPKYKYDQASDTAYGDVIEEHAAVYLTPVKGTAESFAQFRADWMRASIGDVVWYNGINPKKKLAGKQIPDAKPLLVIVSEKIPLHQDRNVRPSDSKLFWSEAKLPAKALRFSAVADIPNGMHVIVPLEYPGQTLAEFQREKLSLIDWTR